MQAATSAGMGMGMGMGLGLGGSGGGGSSRGPTGGMRLPPGPEEKRLLELLEACPATRLGAIVKCLPGWQFEGQANLHNWRRVLETVTAQLTAALARWPRLLVVPDPERDGPKPKAEQDDAMDGSGAESQQLEEEVFELLRFLAMLLENASNKHVFTAVSVVTALLGARSERVAVQATHVAAMLTLPAQQHRHAVDPTTDIASPATKNAHLRRRLIMIVEAAGGASSGLNPLDDPEHVESGAVCYQFYRHNEDRSSELVTIPIPHELLNSNTSALAADLAEGVYTEYRVPEAHQFRILARIRHIASQHGAMREELIVQRLHALVALFYAFCDSVDVTQFVDRHPDLTRTIVELIRVENSDTIPTRVRVAALQVLGALVHDRAGRAGGVGLVGRQTNVLQALGVGKGMPHGVFPSLVRFCITELSSISTRVARARSTTARDASDPGSSTLASTEAEPDMDMSLAVAFVQATSDLVSPKDAELLSLGLFRDVSSPVDKKLWWIEAVLELLNIVVSIQSGASVLTENGVVPALLHVISSTPTCPHHRSLITLCVQALETTINSYSAAAALYRELNGVGIIIDSLCKEVTSTALLSGGSDTVLSETKIVLIVALLVMLSVSFHAQGVMNAGSTSRVIRDGSPLSKALIRVLEGIDVFGPIVFAQASIVVSDIVNNDPSSVNQVHSGGIADAFLQTFTRWDITELYPSKQLPPSSELVMAAPSVISALCLTTAHADKVARLKPLTYLLDCFALPLYVGDEVDYMQDVASTVGVGVFDMMRQVSGFDTAAIQACIAAGNKIVRFGEQKLKESKTNYAAYLRMSSHFGDLLEPIISKSESAACFADNGGVECLFRMYRLILPTTSSFLTNLLGADRDNRKDVPGLTHQPAAQSITFALRSFGAHQPTTLLHALVSEIGANLDALRDTRTGVSPPNAESNDSIDGLLCSMPDVALAELFGTTGDSSSFLTQGDDAISERIRVVGAYLRLLAYTEWLAGALVWTIQTAQSHLHSRRWFSELSSKKNLQILGRLFQIDRSAQLERARLAGLHRQPSQPPFAENVPEPPSVARKGLWKLGSLLLLRFTAVCRSLLISLSKSFLATPVSQRRGDDSVHPLAPHAYPFATFIANVLRDHVDCVLSAESVASDVFVKKYFLAFLTETIVQVVFDEKKKYSNSLLIAKLLEHEQGVSGHIEALFSNLFADSLRQKNAAMDRLSSIALRAGTNALKHFADLEALQTSPITASLLSGDTSEPEGSSFQLQPLCVKLHNICTDAIQAIWEDPELSDLSAEKCAVEVIPVVGTILKCRLDIDKQSRDSDARRVNGEGESGQFPAFSRLRNSSLDRDDFFNALFGAHPSRPRRENARTFEIDPATVDSIVSMGFPRRRVEHAIRRIRINDVELAMEWLLSHPDDEGDDNVSANAEAEGAQSGSAVLQTEPDSTVVESNDKPEERVLFDKYNSIRSHFEETCLAILRSQPQPRTADCELQKFVYLLAQHFVVLASRSKDERDCLLGRLNAALTTSLERQDIRFLGRLTHLLAVMARIDFSIARDFALQERSCITTLVQFAYDLSSKDGNTSKASLAPLFLMIDSVLVCETLVASTTDSNASADAKLLLDATSKQKLVQACVLNMSSPQLDRETAHAIWSMLTHLASDYSLASVLFANGGVDAVLNIQADVAFPAYPDLTGQILALMLESPEVLEYMMEDKIRHAMTKLSDRFGSPSQMRITPRALMNELAPVAARNESAFLKALQNTVTVKRSESGRTYLVPKSSSDSAPSPPAPFESHQQTARSKSEDDKKHAHRLPRNFKQHAHTVVNKLIEKIRGAWAQEKSLPEVAPLLGSNEESEESDITSAGTYLRLLVELASAFPVCSHALTKAHKEELSSCSEQRCLIALTLKELLPSVELCRFASVRRTIRDNKFDTPDAIAKATLSKRVRERVRYSHKLLVTLAGQSGDGPKHIVSELIKLFQNWPESPTIDYAGDLSIENEVALSQLHAWSALTMSILWPHGSSKSFSWDKVVLGGGLQGKYAFVTLLTDALRKISLSHPFAHSTCSMLLRPLATLTRSVVTHKVKRLLNKRSQSQEPSVDNTVQGTQSASSNLAIGGESSQLSGPSEAGPNDVNLVDVAMQSPTTAGDVDDNADDIDHEMDSAAQAPGDDSDSNSELSDSDHSIHDQRRLNDDRHDVEDLDDLGDQNEDEDEDVDEDEDEEEDDEDEDDDEDDDDEDDDDDDRIRLRVSRRAHDRRLRPGYRSWETFGGDPTGDGLDEVEEEEFSYPVLLDDELAFAGSREDRSLTSVHNRDARTPANSTNQQMIRSLVDMFTQEGGTSVRSRSQSELFTFADDDDDEDDPDGSFRTMRLRSRTASGVNDVNNIGTALLQVLERQSDADDDFIFETVEAGSTRRSSLRGDVLSRSSGRNLNSLVPLSHPLLRPGIDDTIAAQLPNRLAIPRHTSLLRELQELTEQVHSHLPHFFGGRGFLSREQGRAGRNRPPSRSHLSTVSSLLNEFSLDIPTSQHLLGGHGRSNMPIGAFRRAERDIMSGNNRLFRGDVGLGNNALGASTNNGDIRTIASRLEQQINQLVSESSNENQISPPVATVEGTEESSRSEAVRESDAASSAEHTEPEVSRQVGTDPLPEDDGGTAPDTASVNEAASDTASVIALASTLGESSLRSPHEDAGSETEMTQSPVQTSPRFGQSASQAIEPSVDESGSILPPPPPISATDRAPVSDLMNFTLDLTSFHTPSSSSARPLESDQTAAEISHSGVEVAEQESSPPPQLVCPEGVDPEVFSSLPPEMQAEIIAQHAPDQASSNVSQGEVQSQLDIDMANSSFDRETLEALPPDIRAEVLANERREREAAARAAEAPADISRAEEMDNASFVASLDPALRAEILTTCDDDFLQSLPSQVQAEAAVLRERATFPGYRATEPHTSGNGSHDDDAGDIFRRPTLRRMLTSHGVDIYGGRRSSRRGAESHRRTRDDHRSTRRGMVKVLRQEEEYENERILNENSVKSVLRLLFMAQSIVHNRVFQRLVLNVCQYPQTRASIRKNVLLLLTHPLERPLLGEGGDVNFPPKNMYGCLANQASWMSTASSTVPPEVLGRVLRVLVYLAKHNARFAVEMLDRHGLKRRNPLTTDSESGIGVVVELLTTDVVTRSATILDLLLEFIELVLTPLMRLRKQERSEADEESKGDESADERIEWVPVPAVEFSASRMHAIVGVLSLDICSPQMQDRTIQILRLLDCVPANRSLVLDALVSHARGLASPSNYRAAGVGGFESAAVLRVAQDELKLLRVLHTLSDVCETTAQFSDCCAQIGLDSLWKALSTSLDQARSGGSFETLDMMGGTRSREQSINHGTATGSDERSDGMVIEGKSAGASCAMAALLARFLPMVEAFFVVNARYAASMSLRVPDSSEREEAVVNALRTGGLDSIDSEKPPDGGSTSEVPRQTELKRLSSTVSEAGESMRLASFVEANRVLLNLLVREKPTLLDASLAALIKIPRCRAYVDFDNKRTYFQFSMKKLRQSALRTHVGGSSVRIQVRRDHIFEDSYYALRMRSGTELRRKLHITFSGEEGIDAGGVTREWYVILAREIFNPNYVLFTSAADSPTFQPNPLSYVNKDHLSYFEFVGKVIGKAVADGQLLDAHFTRSFYKHILQLPISYHDMEAIDPEYYRNLHSILDNSIEDLGLDLTFSAEQSNFGRLEIVDLIPNGRSIAVTDENKMEYVKLVTHHRMATGIRQQIDAFLKGFHQLVPPELISIFNENELELLISGMPEIDIDDLKANTEYANYKPTDAVIRWFWNVLYTFNHEEQALFLQFVTGTSKVPLEGFKALEGMRGTQRFNIHKAYGNPNALPSAHTCFNQLDLPEYQSEEKLRQCLLLAIREGTEGFGFG